MNQQIEPALLDIAEHVARTGATPEQAERHVANVSACSSTENLEYAIGCAVKQLQLTREAAAAHVEGLDVAAIAKAGRNGDIARVRELLIQPDVVEDAEPPQGQPPEDK